MLIHVYIKKKKKWMKLFKLQDHRGMLKHTPLLQRSINEDHELLSNTTLGATRNSISLSRPKFHYTTTCNLHKSCFKISMRGSYQNCNSAVYPIHHSMQPIVLTVKKIKGKVSYLYVGSRQKPPTGRYGTALFQPGPQQVPLPPQHTVFRTAGKSLLI